MMSLPTHIASWIECGVSYGSPWPQSAAAESTAPMKRCGWQCKGSMAFGLALQAPGNDVLKGPGFDV